MSLAEGTAKRLLYFLAGINRILAEPLLYSQHPLNRWRSVPRAAGQHAEVRQELRLAATMRVTAQHRHRVANPPATTIFRCPFWNAD